MDSTLMSNKSIELFQKKIEEYGAILESEGDAEEYWEAHSDGMYAALRIYREMIKSGEIT